MDGVSSRYGSRKPSPTADCEGGSTTAATGTAVGLGLGHVLAPFCALAVGVGAGALLGLAEWIVVRLIFGRERRHANNHASDHAGTVRSVVNILNASPFDNAQKVKILENLCESLRAK